MASRLLSIGIATFVQAPPLAKLNTVPAGTLLTPLRCLATAGRGRVLCLGRAVAVVPGDAVGLCTVLAVREMVGG